MAALSFLPLPRSAEDRRREVKRQQEKEEQRKREEEAKRQAEAEEARWKEWLEEKRRREATVLEAQLEAKGERVNTPHTEAVRSAPVAETVPAEPEEEVPQTHIWRGTGGPPKPGSNWIRTIWRHEEHDFTPWLARELHLVSACTGLDLRLKGREVDIPMAGRADIVALDDGSKSKVVIENQVDEADIGHMQRLSAYGDGLDARIRIWIAARFSWHHRDQARKRNEESALRPGGAIYYLLELRPHPTMPFSLVVRPTGSQAHLDFEAPTPADPRS